MRKPSLLVACLDMILSEKGTTKALISLDMILSEKGITKALISAFVVPFLESIISKHATSRLGRIVKSGTVCSRNMPPYS